VPIDLTRYPLFANGYTLTLLANQGYCNNNYIAKIKDQLYLVRHLKMQGIDRVFEFKVQHKAYLEGIAPKPLILDLEQNIMVTSYSQGEHLFFVTKKELRKLALTIRKLHKIKIRKKPHNHKKDFKLKHKKANAILLKLKKYNKELVLNHHDLNPRNILFANKVTVVDWEFAGLNDRYFDLATICVEFKLNKQMQQYFLRQYFGSMQKPCYQKLELYKELYQELYRVWMSRHFTKSGYDKLLSCN